MTQRLPGPESIEVPAGTPDGYVASADTATGRLEMRPAGTVQTLTAGATVSGQRVVSSRADGTVQYASAATLSDATRQLWITLGAASIGDPVQCLAFGYVTEAGWSWTDAPIFLGLNGVLTQTPPALPGAVFLLQVAAPDGPTALVFYPRTPYQL